MDLKKKKKSPKTPQVGNKQCQRRFSFGEEKASQRTSVDPLTRTAVITRATRGRKNKRCIVPATRNIFSKKKKKENKGSRDPF